MALNDNLKTHLSTNILQTVNATNENVNKIVICKSQVIIMLKTINIKFMQLLGNENI